MMVRALRRNLAFARNLAEHKFHVYRAGRKLGVGRVRLLAHDLSKLMPVEWGPRAQRLEAGRAGKDVSDTDPFEWHVCWTNHWHRNTHHWEHWLYIDHELELRPLPMPEMAIREMVADWMGASKAYTGSYDISVWFEDHFPRMILHPETRERVRELVDLYARSPEL